jgi:hypothetical protein
MSEGWVAEGHLSQRASVGEGVCEKIRLELVLVEPLGSAGGGEGVSGMVSRTSANLIGHPPHGKLLQSSQEVDELPGFDQERARGKLAIHGKRSGDSSQREVRVRQDLWRQLGGELSAEALLEGRELGSVQS